MFEEQESPGTEEDTGTEEGDGEENGGEVADLLDPLGAKPPRDTLVGDARVAEAVADHVLAALTRRADHLGDQLGAGGAEQEQLGQRIELQPGVLEQPADPLAGVGSARFAHQDNVVTERPGEQLGLGRLAGSVDSLE